jgi:hypothetical protein
MRSGLALGLLCLMIEISSAGADDRSSLARARLLFKQGNAAFEAGNYDLATRRFQAAFDISGKPLLLYNIGVAAERAMQPKLALQSFQRFLDLQHDASAGELADVREHIGTLERVLQWHRGGPAEGEPAAPSSPVAKPAPPVEPTPAPVAAPPILAPPPAQVAAPVVEPPRPRRRRVWLAPVIVGATLLAAGGVALGLTLGFGWGNHLPTVTGVANVH